MQEKLFDEELKENIIKLCNLCKKLRIKKKIPQAQVAAFMQTSVSAVSFFENYHGKGREPRLTTIVKYADAINHDITIGVVERVE